MDELGFLVLVGLVVLAIPIMGLVAFFRTGSLRRQVAELEQRIATLENARPLSLTTAEMPTETSLVAPEGAAEPRPAGTSEAETTPEPAEELPIAASQEAPGEDASAMPPVQPPTPAGPPRSLEETIGTRWVVWVGGLALGLGGLFLVRYSIEQGWFGPAARCIAGALFALALVAAGDWMRRRELANGPLADLGRIPGAHIPSVLTAAGTLSAFGSIYAAQALYGLIGPALAFVLLAVVGLGTMLAAALHGPMLAGFGLVASYAAPALVSSGDPRPLPVVVFLAVVAASAYGLSRIRRWPWLAIATAVGAAIWARLLMDLSGHAPEASLHILLQTGLAALMLAILPYRGHDEVETQVDWLATGVLVAFAVLGCELLTDWDGLGSGRAPFAGLMLVVLGGAGLLVAPVAGACLAAAAVAIAALVGWPVLEDLAKETPTVFPAPGSRGPLPDTLWLFLVFAGLSGAALLAGGFVRLLRSPHLPRFPAGLYAAAAVLGPVALLVAAWWRIAWLDRSIPFAVAAGGLALLFVGATRQLKLRFAEQGDLPSRYGYEAFAAGALGALAVGLTMALDKGSLTVALALASLGAAWITTREPLGLLRFVIGAMGLVVAGRLAWDPTVVSGDLGSTPIFNWLLWGYGVPAVSFGLASVLLRRQADDQVVALCEALSVAFTGFLVCLELHHWVNGGRIMTLDNTHLGSGLQAFACLMMGVVLLALEVVRRSTVLRVASYVFGALGLGWSVLGLLLVNNPLFNGSSERIVGGPIFNSLLVAYLLPAVAAVVLAQLAREKRPPWFAKAALGLGFVLALAYVVLEIRRIYQGDVINLWRSTSDAEFYTYSAAFLAIGLILLAVGLFRGSREARLASAVFITLAVVKAFLFDMAGLTGPYRALSFIGLGLVLVGIGLVYQKLVFRRAPPGPAGPAEPPPGDAGDEGPTVGAPSPG